MAWVVDNKKKIINPYNFIPLGEECRRKNRAKQEGNLTGVIECQLIPKTDIFIPNTSNDNVFATYKEEQDEKERHLSYDFYSYCNLEGIVESNQVHEPVIPGSELRGMIRNEYETLTNSCLSTDYDEKLIRRTMQSRIPGILIYNLNRGWVLYPAKRIPLDREKSKKFHTGDIVKIYANNKICKQNDETLLPIRENQDEKIGIVLIGEGIGKNRKKSEHIFYLVSNNKVYCGEPVEKALRILEEIIQTYRVEQRESYKNYHIPTLPKEGDAIPVWYYVRESDKSTKLYFSPAALGKDIYYNSLTNIVGNQTLQGREKYFPCDQADKLCDTCHLFGTVSNQKESKLSFSVTGKLRFLDARLVKKEEETIEQYYRSPCHLKVLAGPKINCVEFYTHIEQEKGKRKVSYWDYDWAQMSNIDISEQLRINGRKFYWHQKKKNYRSQENNNLNITARVLVGDNSTPSKKIPKFKFKVYFDKVSELELERILWILSLGDNQNELCHKIGMGKPIGLGSIKIQVLSVMLRSLSLEGGKIIYSNKNTEEYKKYYTGKIDNCEDRLFQLTEKEKAIFQSFIKIMDFHELDKYGKTSITYPIGIDKNGNETIFNWFTGNKKIGTGKGTKFYKILPKIKDQDIELPVYKEEVRKNR